MKEDLPQRDELERKLRAEARDFEMEPSGLVWEHIRREIPRENTIKRPLVFSLSFLLVAGLAGGLFFRAHRASRKLPIAGIVQSLQGSSRDASGVKALQAPRNLSGMMPSGSLQATIRVSHPAGRDRIVHALSSRSFASLQISTGPTGRTTGAQPGVQDFSPLPSLPLLSPTGLSVPLQADIDPAFNRLENNIDNALIHQKFSLRKLLPHPLQWDLFFVPSINFRWISLPASSGVTYYYYMQSPFLVSTSALDPGGNLSKNSLNQFSELGFAAGIHVHQALTSRLSLVSGLELDRFGYGIEAVPVYPTLVLQTGSGPGSGSSSSFYNSSYAVPPGPVYNINLAREVTISNTYYYLSLPLLANYRMPLPSSRWKLNFSAGMDLGYLLYEQSNILSPETKVYYSDNSLVRRWEPDLNASIYFSIPFTRGTMLQLGPEFRYQPLSTWVGYSVREHPYSLGIRLGLGKK